MSQKQSQYIIAEKPYSLEIPHDQFEMDELLHGAVQGVNDALASLAMYIKYLREFKRNPDEILAAGWLQERLRQIEDSSYWLDLCDTADLVEERRPF